MSSRWLKWRVFIRLGVACFIAVFAGLIRAEAWHFPTNGFTSQDYQRLLNDSGPGWMWLSPDLQWLIVASGNRYPSSNSKNTDQRIKLLGREFYLQRPLEAASFLADSIKLINIKTGHRIALSLPERQIKDIHWAPDSESFALIGVSAKALDIWRFNIAKSVPERWSDIEVSAQLDSPALVWLPDSSGIIIRRSRMRAIDTLQASVASIQASAVQAVQTRIYRDTLDTELTRQHFAALLSQQAVLLLNNGQVHPLTPELLIESLIVSPDGRYLLVQHFADEVQPGIRFNRLAREYQVVEIATGAIATVLPKLETNHLRAREPDAAAKGARLVQWLPNQPATLIWTQSIVQHGHTVEAGYRDAVLVSAAPFKASPTELFKTGWRLHQLQLTGNGRLVYSDFHAGLKQLRYWSLLLQQPNKPQNLLLQYDYANRAEFPGELVSQLLPDGSTQLVSNQQQAIYFQAQGQSRWGDGAFLVKQQVDPAQRQIVLSNIQQQHKSIIYLRIQYDSEWLLLTAESAMRAPSLWLKQRNAAEQLIYDWHSDELLASPAPELLAYKRSDGVQLYSQLYLPTQEEKTLLPALIWLYPRENYTLQQIKPSQQSKFQPIDPLGPLVALLDGYAVVDASQMPITGQDGKAPNDTFMQQQQQNIAALREALKQTGRIDDRRLVLMGHSYGAFSTVSLLTERSDFRCAIARSGAYNRSLTPLGFQGEKRTLWQAPDLYQQLSPFFHADKIKTPVLLIHGLADENPGTSPLQSEMMFQALQANQVHAKLLLLKDERHNYRYRESITRMLTEQSAWLRQCAQAEQPVDHRPLESD